ncbi:MAG: asparaginase [Lysobacteraceae bacterium]|nr:MAG: asparaginase [Xanthomonadaceae bacterium]
MKLTVITTGGTIDKVYFDAESDYQIGDPQIAEILKGFNVAMEFDVKPLMRKDSLELTDADRDLIYQAAVDAEADKIIITHGTDTMVQTANRLTAIPGKTIVLTGALNPARFVGSDAVFNIGCALGAVQTLPPGAYVIMNGRVWDPAHVRKNRAENRFVEVP